MDLGLGGLWRVAVFGLAFGVLASLLFRRWTDRELLRVSFRRMRAHLLELRLFADDPVLILRSQRDLLADYVRAMRAVLLPCGILLLPTAVLIPLLHDWFARAPLRIGSPAVVTVRFKGTAQLEDLTNVSLRVPAGIRLDSEALRIVRDREVCWRIVPVAQPAGDFSVEDRRKIDWIRVNYPRANILGVSWALWFSVFSLVGGSLGLLQLRLL